ncbi:MAG: hypothetical protein ACFB21_02305 [Opitutales bacterium]
MSFHPELRQRAMDRAKALGLSFSRYVALCVESDLGDRPAPLSPEIASNEDAGAGASPVPGSLEYLAARQAGRWPEASPEAVNLEAAIDAGGEYSAAKARSIAFEEDVESILRAEEVCYERLASIAHLRTDFLIQHAVETRDTPFKIALECKHTLRGRDTLTLGQLIVLRSLPAIDAVILCVPYTSNLDKHLKATFSQQGLPLATPDTLADVLAETCANLEETAG